MNKEEIIAFFDGLAESWDSDMIKSKEKIDKIFDVAGVKQGSVVLDVGCGTGVLITDYLNRKVEKCVAVDISQKMIETAKTKFSEYDNIQFLCADAEQLDFVDEFDCAVIYNAFPHFVNKNLLFESLSQNLTPDGRLTVAHGMSREALIKHHSGRAEKVSTILPTTDEMEKLMQPYFDVDVKISTDEIYIVSGKNKKHSPKYGCEK